MAAYQHGDFRGAAASFATALKEAEAFGESAPRLAVTLNNLAELYRAQGRYAEAEPLHRRSLTIREKALGPDHSDVGQSLNNLALLYEAQGRYADAEPLYRRALSINDRALGPNHPSVGTTLNNLAELYRAQGRYAEAEPLHRRSLTIREKALGPDHSDVGQSLNNLALLYEAQGRYADAEPLYRRALSINDRALGPDHPSVGTTLNNLAHLYDAQGRYAEAEPLYRRSLTIREKALGPDHSDVGQSLNNLAGLYESQNRFTEAEPLYRRSLMIREKALGPDHPDVGQSLSNLAFFYKVRGRYAEAEPLYRRSLTIRENALGTDHPDVGQSLNNLAGLYESQSRYTEAEPLYRRSLTIHEGALGPDHPNVGTTLGNLAYLYRQQGRWGEGLGLARRATQSLAVRFTARGEGGREAVLSEQRASSWQFELHVALLRDAHGSEAQAAAEGFEIAQLARASDTAEQVAGMAARHAAGSDALAQLARSRQDAVARMQGIDARLVYALSRAPGQRDAAAEVRLRDEATEARKSLAALDARVEREYPQYRELTDPKPLELAAAQKLLNEDEALVLLLVSGDASYLWALRRGEAGFFKLDIKRGELADAVRKLRAQLDLGATEPARALERVQGPAQGVWRFDVALAHDLYRRILGPADKLLAGAKHLIFVPDGAMQSLPPGVLVTDPPAKPSASLGEHADVAWLAKRVAITVLPAASSLRALRQFARPPASLEPFGGFGNPVLSGSRGVVRGAIPATLFSRGAVADANEVRKLEPLPESADELRAIATALNAPASALRLGPAATERAVKEAPLARYRNLAFATHGLMAGEFKGLGEPALVLTPPETGSDIDDGLLTAGEISQLKLDADWVVLSACNTAAPDGAPGAEGLSGLARAFFYAGARSLLVSHWSVSSDAAVALTTRMFDETAKGVSKAEALRRSMLALMQSPGKLQYAHPAFWAPFVVVGEGR